MQFSFVAKKRASLRDSIILCKYYCHICAIKLTHSLRTASLHCLVWILYGLLFFAGKWSASVSSKYYESRRSLHIHTRRGSVIVWEFHFSLFFLSSLCSASTSNVWDIKSKSAVHTSLLSDLELDISLYKWKFHILQIR